MRVFVVFLFFGFGVCKNEFQKQYEVFGNVMFQFVVCMCYVDGDGKEVGGCNGDCFVFCDVQEVCGVVIVGEHLAEFVFQVDLLMEVFVFKICEVLKFVVVEVGLVCIEKVDCDVLFMLGVRVCVGVW